MTTFFSCLGWFLLVGGSVGFLFLLVLALPVLCLSEKEDDKELVKKAPKAIIRFFFAALNGLFMLWVVNKIGGIQ